MSSGEPQRRLGIDPDRPGRLVLRRQVQPERGDIRRERPGFQPPRTTPQPCQDCGSFTLIPRVRGPRGRRVCGFRTQQNRHGNLAYSLSKSTIFLRFRRQEG
jgi:hypothetical protein